MIDELTSLTRILASQHKGAGGHWKHWTAWMVLWMSRSLWNLEFSSKRTTVVKSVVFVPLVLLECNCDPTRSRRRSISSASRELKRKSWKNIKRMPIQESLKYKAHVSVRNIELYRGLTVYQIRLIQLSFFLVLHSRKLFRSTLEVLEKQCWH